jgi:hypothetical protein
MGANWVTIRDSIRTGSIKKPDDSVIDIVAKFQNLIRYCAFTLSARSGVAANEVVPRNARVDGKKFLLAEATKLILDKSLRGTIRIPGAAAEINIMADVASGVTHCGFDLLAPTEGKNKARLNWMLRQYKSPPKDAMVSIGYKRSRTLEAAVSLSALKSGEVEIELDSSREIALFRIDIVRSSGSKRGRGQGAFIDSVLDQVEFCYAQALQPLKAYVAPAPKLSETVKDLIPEHTEE